MPRLPRPQLCGSSVHRYWPSPSKNQTSIWERSCTPT